VTKSGIGSDSVRARVERALERIRALNPSVNAFITVFEAEALAQAKILDEEIRQGHSRGPLHGLPISVKDLIDVAGAPTTAASRIRAGHVAAEDAPLVKRLREAGAVIIGKCNLHEFALGTTNDESAFGPVRNPRDPRRSPGGSSGGSAAAVATDMCWASMGSDTGGSIRIPAAACGVVGLKPGFGEISMAGVIPLSVSLDHVGPLTRSVADAWTVYAALTGAEMPPALGMIVSRLRLGKLGGYFLERLDNDVRKRFEEALNRLVSAGASMVDVTINHASTIALTYMNIVLPEAAAFHAKTLDRAPQSYSEGVLTRLKAGREIPAEDYKAAQRDRATLRDEVDRGLMKCDALVLPTLPIPAPLLGATTVSIGSGEEPLRPLMLRLTQLFNLTGHPAISLPCGDTPEGLPCGLQLVGRRQQTVNLLNLALRCERHLTTRAS
jgi:aspartyl-tRNA(Asn)/glutamyl-tRNA(Gln) amidotransferase subunit A